jgi:NAD(P)-dependent dehydrogenase (short-subunit alcohol dehydrogenase family)/acyl carrier protein
MEFRAPAVPVWSNTTAEEYPADVSAIRERLADHLVKPVLFSEEIEQMYAAGARIFVEVGPGRTLSGLTRNILGKDELIFHTEEPEGLSHLLSLAGGYMATGRRVRLEKLFEGRDVRLLDLSAPEKFKRSSTVWVVNGQMAVPAVGALPAHGALPIVKPLTLPAVAAAQPVLAVAMGGAERVMEEYLKSMQFMIQAQRDVLMTYLGQAPVMAPVAAAGLTIPVTGTVGAVAGGVITPVAGVGIGGAAHMGATVTPVGMAATMVSEIVVVDIKGLLLKIVSDKTGYPPDMLDLNSDMEADLSIDSIKRMEIIAALKAQLGGNSNNEEDMTERLASVKTLQGLINLIGGMGTEGLVREEDERLVRGKEDERLVREEEDEGVVREEDERLVRLRFELGSSGVSCNGPEVLKGKRFAITDDAGKVSVALKKLLEAHGAVAVVIASSETLEDYDGLILLDLFTSPGRTNILESFALVKKLDMSRAGWVYAVSDLNSHFGKHGDPSMLRHFQGYAGFLKSLDKEWENTLCRTINLDTELSPEKIAVLVVNELLTPDDQPEVSYHAESRKTMRLVPSELTIGQESDIRLDPSSVVLVLGGGQGITAELMIRFSKEYPCRYVLVGRSADPRTAEDLSDASLVTKEAIRESLVTGLNGNLQGGGRRGMLKSPAEIERKVEEIYKRNQILNTITALEKNGATVDYHSLDCRDEEKLGELISGLYRSYGRIDGVVHGAGLLEDKLFRHKTPESFERVFATKVNPLRALATQLKADTQFVVLFSSVASVYGNRGQTDYAAANSVMDQYARELKKHISGKVLAINWGPWKGTGMVSPALEREYERRGISLIPLTAGMEIFLNEVKYGNESQVLIMAGQTF